MKNLTVKKIAMGLFLAGYAASGAYATINPATTAESILGNVPSIYADSNADEHTFSLKINTDTSDKVPAKGKDTKVEVGDYVHLTYQLRDVDGDTDPDRQVANTLTIWVQKTKPAAGQTWKDVPWVQITDATVVSSPEGENGHIYFQITQSMSGAERVGLQLQEKTKYGNPNSNQWLNVADIWSNTNPGTGDKKPDNPGGGDEGPGKTDPDNPVGPIESTATSIGIFKYDDQGNINYTVNLAAPGDSATAEEKTPKYGDKLAAVVWEKPDTTSTAVVPDWTKDSDKTDSYKFTWTLVGPAINNADGNISNEPTPADTDEIVEGFDTTDTIKKAIFLGSKDSTIKHNSVYSAMSGGYKAGIQGFKLKVSAK